MSDEKNYGSKYWLDKMIIDNLLNAELERIPGVKVIEYSGVPCVKNEEEAIPGKLPEKTIEKYLADEKIIDKEHEFTKWWVDSRGKKATWDYICQAEIDGKNGLILLEAKAHEGETIERTKDIPDETKVKDKRQAWVNHTRIENNIADEFRMLGGAYKGYYQIANRIAYANKAHRVLNMPILLVFLGFTRDPHFQRDRWNDAVAWGKDMRKYLSNLNVEDLADVDLSELSSSLGIRIISKDCQEIA